MTMQNPADVRLFSLCDDRIGVAAYNSCHGNDCFSLSWNDPAREYCP